jgi:predicted molibdopterin-dependent oxidoreductase YjgC
MAFELAEPSVELLVDGCRVRVPQGACIAAALVLAQVAARRSVGGEPRAPFCGMGSCQECRVTVNGRAHMLACQTVCESGMRVSTAGRGDRTKPDAACGMAT